MTLLVMTFLMVFGIKAQEWNPFYEGQGIAIGYRAVEMNDDQNGIHHVRLVFRYENKTDHDIQLSFNRSVTYSDNEIPLVQENRFQVSIPAHSSVAYDSEKLYDKTFFIFAQDKDKLIKRSLVSFDIKNIQTD